MPLLDHFHQPLSANHPWPSVHSAWANTIVQHLNGDLLPRRYYALPTVQLGRDFEIDVGTLDFPDAAARASGGLATAVWAPPRPPIALPVEFTDPDIFEVRVMSEEEGIPVAALELVSPGNKDRPANREAFAIKCASYLHSGISVIVIDVVTERRHNLHARILARLRLTSEAAGASDELYAVAYRTVAGGAGLQLEAWPEPLAVGRLLPTMPLWLAPDLVLPLDLEPCYQSACRSLRIEM
jgi:hypothetical protein